MILAMNSFFTMFKKLTTKVSLTALLVFTLSMATLAGNEIHVYSTEIPWSSEKVQAEDGKIYSINEAIVTAQVGDEIVVHEGIYREKLVINKSVFIHPFNNDYVLVTGCERVENWQAETGMFPGVQMADVSALGIEAGFSQLFVDGHVGTMARHPNNTTGKMMEPLDPNSGYVLISEIYKDQGANANGYVTFGATSLPNVDLSGGIFRGLTGKNRMYVFGNVVSNVGNKVTFKGYNKGQWIEDASVDRNYHKAGWGFVLHKNLIDTPGEWFLENNKLYFLPESGKSMSDLRIEVQVRKRVLEISNTTNVSLEGIHFVAGTALISNVSGLKLTRCSWRYLQPFWMPKNYGDGDADDTGVYMVNCNNASITDCYLGHSWGSGFYIASGNGNVFENCVIEDIGWIGIFTSSLYPGGNTVVRKCTFGDSGRFHLRIRGNVKLEVTDCDFYGAMKMGEDAGPIEATSTGSLLPLDLQGSVFAYNKVHDCVGIPVFAGNYAKQFVVAFYMEDTENYTAHHNLVYNMKANNYNGPLTINRAGAFLYIGPRFNAMDKPVCYYNNTVWNYDKGINVWHIEAENWQELGMQRSGGSLDNGHFENNIFQANTAYGLSWTKQIITSTGGLKQWVKVDNPPSITTNDFNAFTQHAATVGYFFNPAKNVIIAPEDETTNFVNANAGDFTLKSTSVAKSAGKVIEGVTASETPDCGALEGGNRVLLAGAELELPKFLEQKDFIAAANESNLLAPEIQLFPNPVNDYFTIRAQSILPQNFQIFNLNGQEFVPVTVLRSKRQIRCKVSDFPAGIYLVYFPDDSQNTLRFIKQ